MWPHLYRLRNCYSFWDFLSFIKWSFLKIQFKWVIDDGKGDLKTGEMGNEQIKYSVWMRISLNSMWTRQVDPHQPDFSYLLLGPSCLSSSALSLSPVTHWIPFFSCQVTLICPIQYTVTLSHSYIHYLTLPSLSAFHFSSFSTVDVRQRLISAVKSLRWVSVTVLFLVMIALPEAFPMGVSISWTFFLDFYCICQV